MRPSGEFLRASVLPWFACCCLLLAALMPGMHRFAHLDAHLNGHHEHSGDPGIAARSNFKQAGNCCRIIQTSLSCQIPEVPAPAPEPDKHPDCPVCQSLALLHNAVLAEIPVVPGIVCAPLRILEPGRLQSVCVVGCRHAVPARAPPFVS